MSDSESSDAEYRFKWSMIAEAEFLYTLGDSIYCILSRTSIKDSDLIDEAEKERKAKETGSEELSADDKLLGDGDAMNVVEENIISQGLEKVRIGGREKPVSDCSSQMESEEMSWKAFCQEKINEKNEENSETSQRRNDSMEIQTKKKKRKLPNKDKFSWMIGLTFEKYWEKVGQYIVNATWLQDYGESMDEDTRQGFERHTMELKPKNVLPSHRTLLAPGSLNDYTNIVYKEDPNYESPSWDDLYVRHSELVKVQAKKDFEDFKKDSALYRCKNFIENAKMCGFIPGFEVSETLEDKASSSDVSMIDEEAGLTKKRVKTVEGGGDGAILENWSGDAENKNLSERRPTAREPVNYGGLEMFDDVYADFYGTPLCLIRYGKYALNKKKARLEVDEETEDLPLSPTPVLSFDELRNFDFGFNETRDACLIAKNACKTYRDDKEMRKYWFQRYRLFSKLNSGILMDREGWFSVTPERIAQNIADRVVLKKDAVVLDAFAGVGGNSIQMALKGAYVIAIDLDPIRIRCAIQNARVYGVAHRINFICTDFFHFAKMYSHKEDANDKEAPFDAVFLSPPWGGPSYLNMEVFDLDSDLTPNGFEIFAAAKKLSPNIAYFLPRQTSVKQLISLAGKGGSCEIEHSLLNKKIKSITAYYGNLVAK